MIGATNTMKNPISVKENARRIMQFDHPEWVMTGLPTWDCSYAGVNQEPLEGPGGHDSPVGTRWRDCWGVGYHKEIDGVMGYPCEHPIEDLSVISSYTPPSPDDPRLYQRIYTRAKEFPHNDAFLSGNHRNTIWERLYRLLGMEAAMIGFMEEPDAIRELIHMIMDFQLGIAKHYSNVGVEVVNMGDDLGTQKGLLFSIDILHEFFVPEYRRLFSFYKERGVFINFHSCGHIEPILEVFMDLGVDILNPLQESANDLVEIRRRTQGRMALMGGVSSDLIVQGPADRIRATVKERIVQLGVDGGYFCGPDQEMPWPEDHYAAFVHAVEEYGTYGRNHDATKPDAE